MCYACYTPGMRTISHREMRNDSGRVLASVEAGESYTVTSNGRPVARLVPVAGGTPIPAARRPTVRRTDTVRH